MMLSSCGLEKSLDRRLEPLSTSAPIKILFVGDLMTGGQFGEQVEQGLYPPEWPFKKIANRLLDSDLVLANLECPIYSAGQLRKEKFRSDKSSILYSSNVFLPHLKKFNFHALCISNNHIHDLGMPGVTNTIDELKKNRIVPIGMSSSSKQFDNCSILKLGSYNVGISSFSSPEPWIRSRLSKHVGLGCHFYSKSNIKQAITHLSKNSDFVVLLFHWGFEKHEYPSPMQRRLAHYAIDSGADLVVGHHPHVIQGYEMYQGKYIFYSLGHFFFSNFRYRNGVLKKWGEDNRLGLMVEATVGRGGTYRIKPIPVYQNSDYQLEEKGAKKLSTIAKIASLSRILRLDERTYRQFWIRYHFSLMSKRLLRLLRSSVIGGNVSLPRKGIRTFRLGRLLMREIAHRSLHIEPERKHQYR